MSEKTKMDKERILVRSFRSIRTYAILAAFAGMLAVLLFSAGCKSMPNGAVMNLRTVGLVPGK